jgi:hypothetical protein
VSTTVEPDTQETRVDDAPAAEQLTCPSCGAPADPGQLMCLECGSRLALDYKRAPSWRLPAVIAGAVVLLAGAGVAFALAQVTNNADKTTASAPTQPVANQAPADTPPTASQPAAAPTPSTPAPAPAPSGTTGATGAAGPTATTATTTPAPSSTPTGAGWPAGQSGFTVIVASLPTEADAKAKLKDAEAAGISGAAILHSDDFPTLRKGWWVVFDGRYDTIGQAQQQAQQDRSKPGFNQAYPRFVSKDANAKP